MTHRWLITGVVATALTAGAIAQDAPSGPHPAVKTYLDCINAEAAKQTTETSDALSDADAVIAACASQKQALINANTTMPATQLISSVENSLRQREAKSNAQ